MDFGFARAGIEVVVSNELMPYACDTYAANHPNTKLLRGDINEYMDTFSIGDAGHCFRGAALSGLLRSWQNEPRR